MKSSFDSRYLLELVRKRASESRSELAAIISNLFDGEDMILTERERAIMFEILHEVVRDSEMTVHKLVSSRPADRPDPPVEFIELLTKDNIEVAFPILSESQVLQESVLLKITS